MEKREFLQEAEDTLGGRTPEYAEVFPEDCRRAFELGVRMVSGEVPEQEPI